MKLLLRLVLGLVLLAALAAAGLLGYLFSAYPAVAPARDVTVQATPEALARGDYLVHHVTGCVDCHSERDWTRFGGPVKPGSEFRGGWRMDKSLDPSIPGVIYGKNITPAAIGSWTDGELLRAIAAGVSRDGTPLFPIMPYPHFGAMAEDDLHAIVAYLRTVRAIENSVPPRSLDFPMNLIVRTIPQDAAFGTRPPVAETVKYGEYVVNAAGCSDCHTPMDDRGQPLPGRGFAGGVEFRLPGPGYRARTANITPDADTGIGSWTEQQFVDKFKAFETPDDHVLTDDELRGQTAMPWTLYAGMTRDDLAAIYAYLRTQPPVVHRVDKHPDELKGQPR